MASSQTQISACISGSTKLLLEEYAEAHGLEKAFLIEQALQDHFQVRDKSRPESTFVA